MYSDEFTAAAGAAKAKTGLLEKNPAGYFLASMLAGAYVGLAILFIFSIGGQLGGAAHTKTLMGACFGIALSLVVMAGSELFTGNNLVMIAGLCRKTVKAGQALKLLLVCYIGNWLGSALIAAIFFGTGLGLGPVGEFIAASAAAKMNTPPLELLMRGILCNALVCLAVWCGYRLKSESAKLVMIFWCVFAFITSGYEHSVANMTLLTAALLAPYGAAVSVYGYFYNIFIVTFGNIIGGVLLVALPYAVISKKKRDNP
jgi:nitrite transporter NirC